MANIEFISPWRDLLGNTEALSLQRRLEFEVTPQHALWGTKANVIARSDVSDDIVVTTVDGGFAIVHLTWGRRPGDAVWPSTHAFSSAAELSRYLRDGFARQSIEATDGDIGPQ